jgi:hypothetical protein
MYMGLSVSAEVHRKWTLAFLDKFSKELYPVYVHGPRNNEELNSWVCGINRLCTY